MNDYKNIDKIKPDILLNLFREVMDNSSDFEFISGTQPFLMSFKNEEFYIYIKNISSAYFSDRDKTTRAQLPIKPEFDTIKESTHPFVFLGYDGVNDVYVCWNFHVAKQRLNVGKSVSFYSRSFFQSEVKEGVFSRQQLKNGDLPVLFKRGDLVQFFNDIHSFFPDSTNIEFSFNLKLRRDSLEEKFAEYLKTHKKLSDKTVKNYSNALSGRITSGLQRHFSLKINSIFFIDDLSVLFKLNSSLFRTNEYSELNHIGKNMYSCAFDNYIEFVTSNKKYINKKEFTTVHEPILEKKTKNKLFEIEDLYILAMVKSDLDSNRILSAAQKIGQYYQDQYPSMELKDWIELAKKY